MVYLVESRSYNWGQPEGYHCESFSSLWDALDEIKYSDPFDTNYKLLRLHDGTKQEVPLQWLYRNENKRFY